VPFDRPAARLREYVLALRAIFAAFAGQAPLRFDGDFYTFSLLTDFFSPGPIAHPNIPVYLAGVNTGLARVAGEVADGFHVHPVNSPRYLSEVVRPAIAAGAAAAGRDPAAVKLVAPVFTIVGDTDAERDGQRAAVRRQIGFYGTTPTYRPIFEAHGWPDLPDRLTAALRAGDIDRLAAEVTDPVLDAYSVTADWDGLAAALRDRYEGLVDRVLPYAITADLDDPELAARWAAVAAAVRAGRS
jgi:probable F420-dependent oxidoreductase